MLFVLICARHSSEKKSALVRTGLLSGRLLGLITIAGFGCGLRRRQFLFDLFAYIVLASIVGDIPTFAFELKSRLGNHLLQTPAAFFTTGRRLVGHLLDNFNLITAFLTTEFVNWHR